MKNIKNLEVYKECLIVVDMVNGFVREGVLHDENIARIIPRQIELIKEAKAKGDLIVFIKDTHDDDSVEFIRFGDTKHCVKGTSEAELVDELKIYEGDEDAVSIEKNSTSFMEAVDFRNLLFLNPEINSIDVVGCCTDICVVNGVMGLANYMNQHNLDVEIRVHKDAVATYNEEERANYVDAAVLLMEQQGVQLVKKK